MGFWNTIRGYIEVHQITQKDIDAIHRGTKAGGVLLKMEPLINDPKAVSRSGVEIAKIIHATPEIQRTGKHTSDHTSYELWQLDNSVTMHIWAKDAHQVKRIRDQYKASYPGMYCEKRTDMQFLPLIAGEYCSTVRLRYMKDWVYPLEIVETEMGWTGVLGACTTEEVGQKAMVQILLDPVPEHKTQKGHRVYAERTRPPQPNRPAYVRSEGYKRLSEAIAHEAYLPHFRIEIRIAVCGKTPALVRVKAGNIVGAFQKFSSTIGGNRLLPVPYNLTWRRAVTSMLNRDIGTFSNGWLRRMQMSTEEVGFNFLSIPIKGAKPLGYTKIERIEINNDTAKRWIFGKETNPLVLEPTGTSKLAEGQKEKPVEQEAETPAPACGKCGGQMSPKTLIVAIDPCEKCKAEMKSAFISIGKQYNYAPDRFDKEEAAIAESYGVVLRENPQTHRMVNTCQHCGNFRDSFYVLNDLFLAVYYDATKKMHEKHALSYICPKCTETQEQPTEEGGGHP